MNPDARRLSLGGYEDHHHETRLLIAAVSAELSSAALQPLERAVVSFNMYENVPGDDTETRRNRRRWNRQHRLRLLRAFPFEKLSPAARKHRDEEEIALPDTPDYDSRIEGGFIGSPVSSEQMAKAADKDILNLFSELSDEPGTSHERFSLRGDIYHASEAFGAFAKEYPARAIALVEQLEPGTQESPAASAIHSLAESPDVDPGIVLDLIRRLSHRGFSSSEFRDRSGLALQKLAGKCNGLPEAICEMLKSWITPAAYDERDDGTENIDLSKQPHSIIWGFGRHLLLPHGNYPVLAALACGYQYRTPPDIDQWLEVLCRHLTVTEHLGVWRALVEGLAVLGSAADRNGALAFLRNLFALFPGALASDRGIFFLARAIRWLPGDFLQQCLRIVECSSWPWKEQGIGEIAMLRAVLDPADEYCRTVVDRALTAGTKEEASDLRRLGIAFAAINLWAEPAFRKRSHEVLMRLALTADGYLPGAIMDVFRVVGQLPPDGKTRELLSVIADNPELVRRGGRSFITDRVKELLSDGFDPQIIAEVTRALLAAAGPALGDIQTTWALDARDLIEISITLQRISKTRGVGLDLFENLMDLGAYEASQVLRGPRFGASRYTARDENSLFCGDDGKVGSRCNS